MVKPIGYLKLHRELASKPIWENSTPEQKVVLITLMLMANFKEKQWEWKGEKFKAEPGQFVTSLEKIAMECGKGISVQNVRSALVRFEKLEFLTNKSTKTGRLITIANWGVYQSDFESQQTTQQRPNKDLTTREERKKEITKYNSDFDLIRSKYPGTKSKAIADKKLPKLIKEFGEDQIIRTIERYVEHVTNQRSSGFKELRYKNESTFWNGAYVDYLDSNYKEIPLTKNIPTINKNLGKRESMWSD